VPYHLTTKKTWDETIRDLDETFRLWKVKTWFVEPMRPPRKMNQSHSPTERIVTMRYTKDDHEVVLVSGSQERAHDNLRALYLAVERMRLIDLAGLTDLVRTAYAQLPPAGQTTHPDSTASAASNPDPYAVLGVNRSDSLEAIERVWRAKLWGAHPDHGGSQEQTAPLNAAMDAIRRERKL